MKISFFLIEPWQKEILMMEFKNHELTFFSEPLNSININKVKDSEILVSRAKFLSLKFNRQTLEQFPYLKMISTMSTGFDYIDLGYCKEKSITVSNVPVYGEISVAEHTFALILSIAKKIIQSTTLIKEGIVNQSNEEKIKGFNLNKKILGVVGSGKIGLGVIKLGKAFGMETVSYDIFPNNKSAQELKFKYVKLDELMRISDIVTLNAPLTNSTYHLLNKENIYLLKPNAVIINTARGELIETQALINFLKDNPDSYAGIDVYEGESEPNSAKLKELLKLNNILITPHNASNTSETKERILNTTLENIKSFLNKKPINLFQEF